jgi:hypothetical protein
MGRCVTQSYLRITACGAAILPDTKAGDFHSRIGTTAPEIESVPADEPEHPLLLNTSADNSAKSKGVICPIALCRARGSYLPHSPAQPKHDSRPRALGCRFLTKLRFQAALEYLGVGFLVYCRGGSKNTAAIARNFRRMASADFALSLIGICHSRTGYRFYEIKLKESGGQASGSTQVFSPESSNVPSSATVKRQLPSPNFLENHMLCPRPGKPRYSSPR